MCFILERLHFTGHIAGGLLPTSKKKKNWQLIVLALGDNRYIGRYVRWLKKIIKLPEGQ